MNDLELLISGFGGQGILFAGKVIAYAGLLDNKEISWLPSYGPEMRGGTANCNVCLSDNLIGSPLMVTPNALIAMNLPSLEKFAETVVAGGVILVDSSIIDQKVTRNDVGVYYVPATKIAEDNGLPGLGNIVLVGKLWRERPFATEEALDQAILKSVPPTKTDLIEANRQALALGKNS